MIRLTLPDVEFMGCVFLSRGSLLSCGLRRPYSADSRKLHLWGLETTAPLCEVPAEQQTGVNLLFEANAAIHLRLQVVWPEGEELPPPMSSDDLIPRVFRPAANHYPLCYHPDGATIVFCEYRHSHGDRYHIRGSKGRRLSPLVGTRGDHFHSGAFSPSGRRLAMRGRTEVKVWNIPTGRQSLCKIETAKGFKEGYVPPVRFINDVQLVASTERAILVWDVVADQRVFKSAGFAKELSALAVSPDRRRLLAGSRDGTVRVWDTTTFDELARYDWQVGKVNALAFAPDGLTAAVAGDSGVVVWDVE